MVRMPRPAVPLTACLCLVPLLAAAPATAQRERGTITLSVDLGDAPRKIFHARMRIPVEPGPLSLSYPKWIPGEHGPTGPLTDLAGLRITAGRDTLAWQRDPLDMYLVRCTVPSPERTVEVALDFLSAATPEGFSSAASATENLALLSWNQVLLYPSGEPSDKLRYEASLRLPSGWRFATALPLRSQSGGVLRFAPVSLTTLIDSPVLTGAYFRSVPLAPGEAAPAFLDMACDSREGLEMAADQIAHYRQLIREAHALFGAHHYRQYHFLLSLSDHVAHFGLEHHESSDDRTAERMWIDDSIRIANTNLMPHELVHSWNGKYRRPAGLATPNYQEPMRDDLLWVYEGLTQYLGFVLGARSGVRTPRQAQEALALAAAHLDHRAGRAWRPLVDTAVEAQLLYAAAPQWQSWRRGVDFYDEGLLMWLEADVTIRRLTQGARSLDDFCRRFHGGKSGPPEVVPYTLDDVVREMNEVAPNDWRRFFSARVDSITPHPPMGGIQGGGWRLVYSDAPNGMLGALETEGKYVDLLYSLGFRLGTEQGDLQDVNPGSPAARAGVAPGMKLVAVNGRKWTKDVLLDAIRATQGSKEPLELLLENGDFLKTFRLDYHGGPRFPHLERVAGKPDVVSQVLKSLSGSR